MGEFRTKLVKYSTYSFAAMVITTILALIRSVIVARIFNDPEPLGILAIVQNMSAMIGTLAIFSMPIAITKFVAEYNVKDKEVMNQIISNAFTLMLFLSLCFSSIYFLFSDMIALRIYHEPIIGLLIKINVIAIISGTLIGLCSGLIRGFQRIKTLSWLGIVNASIGLPIAYFLILKFGLVGAVLSLAVTSLAYLIIISRITHQLINQEKVRITFFINKELTKKLFTFTTPLLLSGFVLLPVCWFANTHLALIVGFDKVGLFKIGYNLYNIFLTLPGVLAIPLLPMISEIYGLNPEKASSTVPRILRMMMLIMLPLILGIGIAAKFLISLLYGQVYVDAYLIAYLLVLTSFPLSLSPIISVTLMAAEKTWTIFGLDIIWALFFIPSAYFLINMYGLTGIGVAYLVSGIGSFGVMMVYFKNEFNMNLKPLRALLILAFFFGIMGFFVINLDNVWHILFYDFILVAVLILFEYFILNSEEKQIIKDILIKYRNYIKPGI
jgi:stage V sporulation protein B